MLNCDLGLGQVVKSISGRDKDGLFFVMKIIDDKYVVISDGNCRKLDNPKLKKVKHLTKFSIISEDIKNKILHKEYINDSLLRCELKRLSSMI